MPRPLGGLSITCRVKSAGVVHELRILGVKRQIVSFERRINMDIATRKSDKSEPVLLQQVAQFRGIESGDSVPLSTGFHGSRRQKRLRWLSFHRSPK